MHNELLSQGLTLMALGMGVVFTFLALLIVTTTFMSTVVQRYFPQTETTADADSGPAPSSGRVPDARIMTVIGEAVRQHRES